MRVEVRTTGRRSRDLVPTFPLPPDPERPDEQLTLRRLIERAVRVELAAANERRAERAMAQVLGAKPGDQAAPAYRPGGRRGPQLPTPEDAVATALEAFQDGLFLVLVDRRQEEDLDAVVALRPDSVVTFVRLVALVGG